MFLLIQNKPYHELFLFLRYGRAIPESYFGPGTGPIVFTNLSCHGNESDIRQCPSAINFGSCGQDHVAGLDCQGNSLITYVVAFYLYV